MLSPGRALPCSPPRSPRPLLTPGPAPLHAHLRPQALLPSAHPHTLTRTRSPARPAAAAPAGAAAPGLPGARLPSRWARAVLGTRVLRLLLWGGLVRAGKRWQPACPQRDGAACPHAQGPLLPSGRRPGAAPRLTQLPASGDERPVSFWLGKRRHWGQAKVQAPK